MIAHSLLMGHFILAGIAGLGYQSLIDPPTPDRIRQFVVRGDTLSDLWLYKYGAAAFPAYRVILTDPKSTNAEIAGVLSALIFVKARKEQFRDLTVSYLSHQDSDVRVTATGLMQQIGTPEEGSILVALLSDENLMIVNAAATALAKTGGRREVVAMDAWLRAGVAHRDAPVYLKHVKTCRDALEKRLTDKN